MFKKLIFVLLAFVFSAGAFAGAVLPNINATPTTVPTAVPTPSGGAKADVGRAVTFLDSTVSQLQSYIRSLGSDARLPVAYGSVSFTANAPTIRVNYGISAAITIATGTLQVTFAEPKSDSGYAVCVTVDNNPAAAVSANVTTRTSSAFCIDFWYYSDITNTTDTILLKSPLGASFIVQDN